MKRPFAIIGFSFFAALLFASYSNTVINTAVMIITAALFILTILPIKFLRNIVYSLCFISMAAAMCLYQYVTLPIYNSAVKFDGKELAVTGRVIEERTVNYGNSYHIIELDTVDGKELKHKIKCRVSAGAELDIEPFSEISTTLQLYVPTDKYGLSSKRSYKSKEIYLFGRPTDDVEVTDAPTKVPYYYSVKFRMAAREKIYEFMPESSAYLVSAMCLGDSDAIPDDIYQNLKLSGVVHLFVVSGLHISIISGVLMSLFGKFKFSSRRSALLTMPFVIFFIMMTGLSPSALRAGIMSMVYLLSKVLFRKSDALNSLGIAAFVLLLLNPFSAFNISFQLSFLSTLGIILSADMAELKRKPKYFAKTISAIYSIVIQTLSATIFTLPVSITVFQYVSLFSVPANILLSFTATLLLVIGMIFIPLAFIGLAIILKPIVFILNIICTYITSVSAFFSKFDFCIIRLDSEVYLLALAIALIFIGIVVLVSKNPKTIKTAVVASLLLFCVAFAIDKINKQNTVTLKLLNVEGGFAAVIEDGNKTSIVGCGGRGISHVTVKNALVNPSSEIDLFVVPKNDTAFAGNAQTIIEDLNLKNISISSFGNTVDYDIINNSGINRVDFNQKITLDNVTFDFRDTEKASAVKLTIKGTDILIPSNRADLSQLDSDFIDCDIIICNKAPKDLSIVKPTVAFVSNTVKTGSKEADRFCDADIDCFTTFQNGDLILLFEEQNEFEIRTNR